MNDTTNEQKDFYRSNFERELRLAVEEYHRDNLCRFDPDPAWSAANRYASRPDGAIWNMFGFSKRELRVKFLTLADPGRVTPDNVETL